MVVATTTVLAPQGVNTNWYLDLNRVARQSSWAHGFMHAYALWAGVVILAVLTIAAIVSARWRPDAPRALAVPVLTAVAAVVALAVGQIPNHLFGELRPYLAHPSALVLVDRANDFSFPSDHSVVAGALAFGLLVYDRRFGIPAAVLALFLAFARVYVGAHYPGDAVGGLILGVVVSAIIIFGLRSIAEALADWLGRTPLRVLVTSTAARSTTEPLSSSCSDETAPVPDA
jgi:membrane-associated phospholipid phosphatase